MNHIEVWQLETHVSQREINWEYYVEQIEAALKVDLGMCAEIEDGHCLDSTYDAFLAGISINDYVKGIRA